MRNYTVGEIEKITRGKLISGSKDAVVENFSMDSRTAKEGDLFVPIVGEVHDAHKFIPSAREGGCKTFFTSREDAVDNLNDCNVILVEDTALAMLSVAKDYLDSLNLRKVAVTGSVGKTSTRDMMKAILSEKYKTGCPEKNYNTDVGVSQTIFSFDDSYEAAVLEVGMDRLGEISRLVDVIRPEVGIITLVGSSHIEHLGSRENILKAKMEIVEQFDETNTLVINWDNDMLKTIDLDVPYTVIKTGTDSDSEYLVKDIADSGEEGISYTLSNNNKDYKVELNIPGAHNAVNSALAIAAGAKVGVSIEEAINGLKKIEMTGRRLKVVEKDGFKVIDDTYNASTESIKSAVKTMIATKGKRKIAILAGINELGENSDKIHYELGEDLAKEAIDILYTQGEKVKPLNEGYTKANGKATAKHFENKEELYKEIDGIFLEGDVILVKASRGQAMEDVVERIINN